jgi:hypothetical protein
MLQKGLIKLIPSFNLQTTKNKKYAIYPIAKAYEIILESIKPGKEQNHFYTFGWSGLMSQSRRRMEAVRFYNAISQELETYTKKGIYPKIRILAHSHGGNLALNLGAVKSALLNLKEPEKFLKTIKNTDEQESLQEMIDIMQSLPIKPTNSTPKGQKRFDYLPEKKDLVINELILFGTPIQTETHNFAFHSLFEKVYNFYSEEDLVQDLDWVSTKKSSSEKTFDLSNSIENTKIIQAKIMMREGFFNTLSSNTTQTKNEKMKWWEKLFYKIFSNKKYNDPTHKELWFISWDKENSQNFFPSVIFTPMFLNIFTNIDSHIQNLDLNIKFTKRKIICYALKHDHRKIESKISLPRDILDYVKSKTISWKPIDFSYQSAFNIIHKYSAQIN